MFESWIGESTPARGGRRRKVYRLLPEGARELQAWYTGIRDLASGTEAWLDRLAGEVGRHLQLGFGWPEFDEVLTVNTRRPLIDRGKELQCDDRVAAGEADFQGAKPLPLDFFGKAWGKAELPLGADHGIQPVLGEPIVARHSTNRFEQMPRERLGGDEDPLTVLLDGSRNDVTDAM